MQPHIALPLVPSHLVLDSPHSGRKYPEDFHHARSLDQLREVEDFHVDELFAFAPELGASLISAPFPRSYLDVNRSPDDIDPELLAPEERTALSPSAKSELGMGLVWRLLKGQPIYDRRLPRAVIERRIDRCWHPYHAAIAQAIAAAHERHGLCIHVNCHSMPSRAHVYPAALDHTMPFDFLVGDRDGTTSAAPVTRLAAEALRAQGFSVGVNQIFKGVELVRRHGDPTRGRHSIQLEINKKLYMDEERLALHTGFERVQQSLKHLVRALLDVKA